MTHYLSRLQRTTPLGLFLPLLLWRRGLGRGGNCKHISDYSTLVFALFTITANGQTATPNLLQSNSPSVQIAPAVQAVLASALPNGSFPTNITERGPHHRVCERPILYTNALGTLTARTNRWTELATGLNVQQPDGQWIEASTDIDPAPGGAIAQKCQTKVFFAANLNTAGAIDVTAPDGTRLRSSILGLAYFDTATGQRTTIAELKDSLGQILPAKNQILYPDAFTNGVKASVLYKYTKAGLQQCVILDADLPVKPADIGMDPQTTLLEAVTEFIDPPVPDIATVDIGTTSTAAASAAQNLSSPSISLPVSSEPVQAPLTDDQLDFGALKMAPGKAFQAGEQGSSRLPVGKSWEQIDQRNFLFERVRYKQAQKFLTNLPPAQASLQSTNQASATLAAGRATLSERAALPSRPAAKPSTNSMLIASISIPDRDFVIDFDLAGGQTDFTFQGDTAYRIVGKVDLYGTTTFEGETTVSYPGSATEDATINLLGDVVCKTRPYSPATFTSDGGGTALSIAQSTFALHDVRFTGFDSVFTGGGSYDIRHAQFIGCNSVFSGGSEFYVGNCLFADVAYCFGPACDSDCAGSGLTIVAENATFHNCPNLVSDPTSTIRLVNSLLVNANVLTYPPFYPQLTNTVYGSDTDFQNAAGGNHYLTPYSSARGAGDPSQIDPILLAELRKKTTQPPTVHIAEAFEDGATFSSEVQRDSEDDSLDAGFHYDALDHVFNGCLASGTISIEEGTFGSWYATTDFPQGVIASGPVNFNGTQASSVCWAGLSTVQESDPESASPGDGIFLWAVPGPTLRARYARYSTMADRGPRFDGVGNGVSLIATHCEFRGGSVGFGETLQSSLAFTNCLFERCLLVKSSTSPSGAAILQNCTMRAGQVTLAQIGNPASSTWPCSIRDSAFDGTTLSLLPRYVSGQPDWSSFDFANNAFSDSEYNSSLAQPGSIFPPSAATDLSNINFNWQTGPLGDFYLLSDSLLIDHGDVTADQVRLYHYTTQMDQTREGPSMVDIGFHYLALDGDGNPIDTDGDGIGDYAQDANCNGIPDPIEASLGFNPSQPNALGTTLQGFDLFVAKPKANSRVP